VKKVDPVELQFLRRHFARRRRQAQNGAPGLRFARAGLADDAKPFAPE